ncbi:hypothetical protein DIPPA_01506 [Diplonema papillatum]|nr:hypothetical protein DIPPA_01506 [Diplonema papillatum]
MSNADWLVVDDASDAAPGSAGETPVDVELLSTMFPGKAAAKLREWVAVLHKEEVERVGDGNRPDWDALPLPAAVRATLHARFSEMLDAKPAPPPPAPSPAEPSDALITQLDCVVLDVSCSMTARSTMDALKT